MMEKVRIWLNGLGIFTLDRALPAAILLAVGVVSIRVILKVVKTALKKSKLEPTAHSLIRAVCKAVLGLLLGLMVAAKLGVDVTGIVALASVLSLAVSLAVQDALSNVIGGFTLLNTKPFVAGDFVDIAGQSGTVREVGLAYTKLNTGDNKLVSIPNSAVVAAQIVNYSANGTRRVDITVSASYDAPIEQVLEALKEAAQVPTKLEEKESFAAVKHYGDSAIEYVLQVWSTADDYWTTLFTVNKRIKDVFDEKGISMTYPHLNVHLDQ